jgi:hypothetical protein
VMVGIVIPRYYHAPETSRLALRAYFERSRRLSAGVQRCPRRRAIALWNL